MILGMSVSTFTAVHVAISLAAIASGLVVLAAMLTRRNPSGLTSLFLATTLLTTLTGFLFPVSALTPALIVGAVSLGLLIAAILARYAFSTHGLWRPLYVFAAIAALYLNVFVLIVQSFQKIAALQALAPTQSEPPFVVTQLIVLALFVCAGAFALARFRPLAAAAV
jgi:hypothetical protein